jgi:PAS domain S-box-containing protein
MEDFSSVANDGSPCVFISGESERLGQILSLNLSMCKVFGYTRKDDLLGKDVEVLMPRMYAKQHRRFLEVAIGKSGDMITARERIVFGRHASGYIFPVWLSIKSIPSFVTGRQFAATFKVEKSGINKNVAYLILDKNKNLVEASASALAMLEIDL